MGVLRRSMATVLMLLAAGAFNPVMAAGRYFTFGTNPVDPTRQETLKPGQCILALAADSPFPVTVKARYGDSGEFQTDTAYVQAGEEIVISSRGVALYISRCGNDIMEPNDWMPEGTTVRCEPGIGENTASLFVVPASTSPIPDPGNSPAKVVDSTYSDSQEAELGADDEPIFVPLTVREEKPKKKWPWILAGLVGGLVVGAALAGDDESTIDNTCSGNCR